ncbi:Fe-S-containing hydro-lyase, partial [Chloroflexota bacterium]
AHFLRGYQGKCEALHGHRFRVMVRVTAAGVDDIGIAYDFAELKRRYYKGYRVKGVQQIKITSPLDSKIIQKLTVGTRVLIDGVIYAARDAAHKRLVQTLDAGAELPFDLKGQTLYYMGPSPTRPGWVIGAAGPTTSGRMDGYTPRLIVAGIRAMIGKGSRSVAVIEAMQKYKAVYFAASGGAGALLAKSIKGAEVIAYEDLGAEAILRLYVENFPAIVANDIHGADLFQQGKDRYRRR